MRCKWSRRSTSNIFPFKFSLFPSIQTQSFSTLSSLLNLCTKPQYLQQIHARFILHGLHQNQSLSAKLVDSYSNLGNLCLSRQVFSSIVDPDSHLYNTFLRNLCKFSEFESTLLVYKEMVLKSIFPDEDTYPFVLRSCSCLKDIEFGNMIHGHVVKLGFDSFHLVYNAVMELYSNCGSSKIVQKPFEEKIVNGVSSLNTLFSHDFRDRKADESFQLFEKIKMQDLELSSVTVIKLLRSSVDLNSLKVGRAVHCLIVVCNLFDDLSVNTALLSMYSKLGSLEDARMMFVKMPEKDCVVWNVMISGYSRNGYPKQSLELLGYMGRSGVKADLFTALAVIPSITKLKSTVLGKQMHAHVIRNGSDYHVSVQNSLVDMYSESDNLTSARKVFYLVASKTVVTWSSMIKGYVTHDQPKDALNLFNEMKSKGTEVDFITVINVLPACVNIGALEQVKYLHGYSLKFGLNSLPSVNTAFLVSYAKCGCIEMAWKLFDEEKVNGKDIVSWNSMITAYAKHGNGSKCFELYNQMKQSNLRADEVTFLGLLTACVYSGSVKEGKEYFKEMTEIYGCQPNQEHYACLVDLLGRAGQINEAREIIKTLPFEPDARIWGPLLSACKIHSSDTKLAESVAEKLITMEPKNAGNYILLSNIYAAGRKWDKVAKIRSYIRDRGLKKTTGCSWLEINGHVHNFHVADKNHPESYDIYAMLEYLEFEIRELRNRGSDALEDFVFCGVS